MTWDDGRDDWREECDRLAWDALTENPFVSNENTESFEVHTERALRIVSGTV